MVARSAYRCGGPVWGAWWSGLAYRLDSTGSTSCTADVTTAPRTGTSPPTHYLRTERLGLFTMMMTKIGCKARAARCQLRCGMSPYAHDEIITTCTRIYYNDEATT